MTRAWHPLQLLRSGSRAHVAGVPPVVEPGVNRAKLRVILNVPIGGGLRTLNTHRHMADPTNAPGCGRQAGQALNRLFSGSAQAVQKVGRWPVLDATHRRGRHHHRGLDESERAIRRQQSGRPANPGRAEIRHHL